MYTGYLAGVAFVVLSFGGAAPVFAQQESCRFVLGFATLRDLVGTSKVGNCLEDEHFNLENGNAEQRTSGDLLVWRKIDNFTAFTDGGTTWVNGPNGLQSRPNSERFSWERDPVQPGVAPPPSSGSVVAATSTPTAAPRTAPAAAPVPKPVGDCHPSYPDFCVPPGPPDVNCNSPVVAGRTGFRVLSPDPHRLDQDGNGIACESSRR